MFILIKKIKKKYFDSLSISKREISINIGLSFVAKGLSLLVTFISVPILLSYLGKDTYGIWLTIFSVISWISFFDLGLGNGLRNHLILTLAEKDSKKAQQYISTAYWLLGGFIILTISVLQVGVLFIDWIKVFRPSVPLIENFNIIISICLWGSGLLLVSRLIVSILQARKNTGIGNLLMSIGSLVSLMLIFIVSNFELKTKLYHVAYIFSWVTPIILLLFSMYFFGIKNSNLRPRFQDINKILAKNIFGLGLEFFLAQFFVLILYQSSNIIITQILSPADVTVYYVPLRLFSVFSIIMSLVSNNLLPYVTAANATNNFLKMKKIVEKFYVFFGLLILLFSLVLIFSESLISLWTKNQIKVPFQLLGLHFVLVIIMGFISIFSTILNGIGKIRAQLPVFLLAVVFFVPLGILMGKKYGLSGLVIATIISQIPICFFFFLQTKKHLNNMEAKK